jgi:catechol 2,3-dioxygenase
MTNQNSPQAITFSHLGIFATDVNRLADFYKNVLLFFQTDSGKLGTADLIFLSRDPREHHQLVLVSGRPKDLAFSLINQISFRVPDLAGLRTFYQRLEKIEEVSDLQAVTHGNAISIYFRDPEKNRVEIFMDTPWYCEQPLRETVDLGQSEENIMASAKKIAEGRPGFCLRTEWIKKMSKLMGYEGNE